MIQKIWLQNWIGKVQLKFKKPKIKILGITQFKTHLEITIRVVEIKINIS